MNQSRPCSAPPAARRLTLTFGALTLCLASIACGPPAIGHRSPLSACDGGPCADAALVPPECTGEGCSAPPPGTHDGPYVCAPGVVCEAWQDCLDGVCTGEPPPPSGGCLADAECASGESCVDGACVPAPGGDECASDADCSPGEGCVAGRCGVTTTTSECTSDADCTGGTTCIAGTCGSSSGSGGGCFGDEHCH